MNAFILMFYVCGGSTNHCEWKEVLTFRSHGDCISALREERFDYKLGNAYVMARCAPQAKSE